MLSGAAGNGCGWACAVVCTVAGATDARPAPSSAKGSQSAGIAAAAPVSLAWGRWGVVVLAGENHGARAARGRPGPVGAPPGTRENRTGRAWCPGANRPPGSVPCRGRRSRARNLARRLALHQRIEAGKGIVHPGRAVDDLWGAVDLHQDVVLADAQQFAVLQGFAVAAMHAHAGIHQMYAVGAGVGQVVGAVTQLNDAMLAGHQALRVWKYPVVLGVAADFQLTAIKLELRALAGSQLVITGDCQTQRH